MKYRALLAGLSVLLSSAVARADTLASATNGGGNLYPAYVGETFKVMGVGAYDQLRFNLYTAQDDLTPFAIGTAYLFGSEYAGTPGELPTATGLLGSAPAVNDVYIFPDTVSVTAGDQYFLYIGAVIPIPLPGNGHFQPESRTFLSSGLDDHYTTFYAPPVDFLATGQSVTPEPSSFALFGTGVLGMAGVLRKRFS